MKIDSRGASGTTVPRGASEDRHRRLIETGIAAETARSRSVRRIAGASFLAGAILGGLFGFQAVLSEGWVAGSWFVFGVGLAGGIVAAIVLSPLAMLRGWLRRRRVIRDSGFSKEDIDSNAAGGAGAD